jgi:hypothetical protein
MPAVTTPDQQKVPVALRLPPRLVRFLDDQAAARFTTRNEVIQSLVVEAFHNAQRSTDA